MPTTTSPITEPVVDILIEGLKQGVDYVIPIALELDEGEDDETALDFAENDVGILEVFQRTVTTSRSSGRVTETYALAFTLSTASNTITPQPTDKQITLHLSNEMTKGLKASENGIDLRGTLYLEDTAGNSRPCSGQDVHIPLEPSYRAS